VPTPFIGDSEPVDGFTVERDGDRVALILSNRYGHVDRFYFDVPDAVRLATSLLAVSAPGERNQEHNQDQE